MSILMNKLPSEIRLIVTRETAAGTWNLTGLMSILEREVDAREHASASGVTVPPRRPHIQLPTGAALLTSNPTPVSEPSFVYCGQHHMSTSCTTVTGTAARKDILRRTGRCYVCMGKNHLSKDCCSSHNCRMCRGRHHVTICHRQDTHQTEHLPTSQSPRTLGMSSVPTTTQERTPSTNNMYIDAQTPILLQTAKMQLFNPSSPVQHLIARAVMDSGSQRTYVTNRLREQLNLRVMRRESLRIKTFGSTEPQDVSCDVIELGVRVEGDDTMKFSALVVSSICNPLMSQPINHSRQSCDHLVGLELADSAEMSDVIEIDVLIGSDMYWDFVSGEVIRGDCGPTAIHTKVGWILSGPMKPLGVSVNLTLTSAHTLKVDLCHSEELRTHVRRELKAVLGLGITRHRAGGGLTL